VSKRFQLLKGSVRQFDAVSRGITFSKGVGLPGGASGTSKPAWIPDVLADSNFRARRSPQRPAGAVGFPSLPGPCPRRHEFFSREIREPIGSCSACVQRRQPDRPVHGRKRADGELDQFFSLSLDLMCVAGSTATSSA
jgi:hypothetical protein